MEFFIEGDPPRATAQERRISMRNGRPHLYDPDSVKYAKQYLALHLSQHRPQKPMEGPVMLWVGWYFRASRANKAGTWKTTRPDTDNLQKILKDVMTRCGYWKDDAQVCAEIVIKCWSKTPGIRIVIHEMEAKSEEV